MGRWSRHPMGSDGAHDARDAFFAQLDDPDNDKYYFELPKSTVQSYLQNITLEELVSLSESMPIIGNNKFVIPYSFIEYKVYPEDEEIKKYLLTCLDSHDDITGKYNYCNGEEMQAINFFKENFEDIISGKVILPSDKGLLATINDEFNTYEKEIDIDYLI